jgi:endonuclease III
MNRTAVLTKLHKVLKKHYKPVPTTERTVLAHLLYACCLENATYEAADKAFAAVSSGFFDWNEVRVSTVKELGEVMHMLPDPLSAASNLKRILQGVFESTYSFDLEALTKQNLGVAQQRLKKLEGCTNFAVAFVTQAVLDGHAIPVDRGLFDCLAVLGLVTDADRQAGTVPGMERAIPKNKGVEFGSLVHQLGADFVANPYSPSLHKILLEIAPECKEHLPKKPPKAAKPPAAEAQGAEEPTKTKDAKDSRESGRPKEGAGLKESTGPKDTGPKHPGPRDTGPRDTGPKDTAAPKESKEAKPAAEAAPPAEAKDDKAESAKKKPLEPAKKPLAAKKSESDKPSVEAARPPAKKPLEKAVEKKKSATAGLAKRKPR